MIRNTGLSIAEAMAVGGVSFLPLESSEQLRGKKYQEGVGMDDALRSIMRWLFPPVIYKKEIRKGR
jgi:hypothetical protein